MNITQKIYERLCVMNEDYKKMTIEEVSTLLDRGKALLKIHGEENLHFKLSKEKDFQAVGCFLNYRIATDESLYENAKTK